MADVVTVLVTLQDATNSSIATAKRNKIFFMARLIYKFRCKGSDFFSHVQHSGQKLPREPRQGLAPCRAPAAGAPEGRGVGAESDHPHPEGRTREGQDNTPKLGTLRQP